MWMVNQQTCGRKSLWFILRHYANTSREGLREHTEMMSGKWIDDCQGGNTTHQSVTVEVTLYNYIWLLLCPFLLGPIFPWCTHNSFHPKVWSNPQPSSVNIGMTGISTCKGPYISRCLELHSRIIHGLQLKLAHWDLRVFGINQKSLF